MHPAGQKCLRWRRYPLHYPPIFCGSCLPLRRGLSEIRQPLRPGQSEAGPLHLSFFSLFSGSRDLVMTPNMLLQDDASPRQLEEAAAFNHTSLFKQEAEALGGKFVTTGRLSWTSGTRQSPSMVPFPDLTAQKAGEQLDALVAFYLKYPPKGAGCSA